MKDYQLFAIEAQASGVPTILSENIDNSSPIYSNKVDLLPINKGVSLWIQN